MSTNGAPALETATIHLLVFGEDREITMPVRVGPSTLPDLLPVARALSRVSNEVAVERAARDGRSVSCREGCAACCRQFVAVSAVEALRIADLVAAMPPERQAAVRERFDRAVRQMEQLGLVDPAAPRGRSAVLGTAEAEADRDLDRRYFHAHIDCPLLEDERCGIYEERPLSCRAYNVTTPPELCASLSPDLRTIERPLPMSEALGQVAGEIAGIDRRLIPLPLALEWADVHGRALRQLESDGEQMFWSLLQHIDGQSQTPFEERDHAVPRERDDAER